MSTDPRNSATRKDMFQPLNIKKEKGEEGEEYEYEAGGEEEENKE